MSTAVAKAKRSNTSKAATPTPKPKPEATSKPAEGKPSNDPETLARAMAQLPGEFFERWENEKLSDLPRCPWHAASDYLDELLRNESWPLMADVLAFCRQWMAQRNGEAVPANVDQTAEALRLIASLPPKARRWMIVDEPDRHAPPDEVVENMWHSISHMLNNGLGTVPLIRGLAIMAQAMPERDEAAGANAVAPAAQDEKGKAVARVLGLLNKRDWVFADRLADLMEQDAIAMPEPKATSNRSGRGKAARA